MPKRRLSSPVHLRLLPMVALTLAILVLPTTVYAWGRTSPSFKVEKVVVSGADLVSQRRLDRLLSEAYVGRNLFTVTGDDVRESLGVLPYVAASSVNRDFPSTLRVEIVEHRPLAYAMADNGWFVVSDGGFVITTVGASVTAAGATAKRSPSPVPSVSAKPAKVSTDGVTAEGPVAELAGEEFEALRDGPAETKLRLPRMAVHGALKAGENLPDGDAAFVAAALASLPPSLRQRVAVAVVEEDRATLTCSNGLIVVWGDGERHAAKSIALRTVLAHYARKGTACTFIDVSLPDRVLARPLID